MRQDAHSLGELTTQDSGAKPKVGRCLRHVPLIRPNEGACVDFPRGPGNWGQFTVSDFRRGAGRNVMGIGREYRSVSCTSYLEQELFPASNDAGDASPVLERQQAGLPRSGRVWPGTARIRALPVTALACSFGRPYLKVVGAASHMPQLVCRRYALLRLALPTSFCLAQPAA